MTSWQVAMAANSVIAVAYLSIATAIVVPLWRSHQLRTNLLGAATAGIFLTCAVHHGAHSLHMLMPVLGDDSQGLAMRAAWSWPLAVSDVVGACVAVVYWTQRRSYRGMLEGATLFADLRQREQRALELNDTVLQGLVVAQMSLGLGQHEKARAAIDETIDSASRIITDLLGSDRGELDLVRAEPAALGVAGAPDRGDDRPGEGTT